MPHFYYVMCQIHNMNHLFLIPTTVMGCSSVYHQLAQGCIAKKGSAVIWRQAGLTKNPECEWEITQCYDIKQW